MEQLYVAKQVDGGPWCPAFAKELSTSTDADFKFQAKDLTALAAEDGGNDSDWKVRVHWKHKNAKDKKFFNASVLVLVDTSSADAPCVLKLDYR